MSAAAEVQRTAAVDLGALLDAGDGAVVTLVAGETRLAAHRAVLAARSPVFRAMFQHDTLEASCGEVRITDVEGPVLRQLLSYMYTLQAPQLTDTAPELLAAADRYGLSALKAACEQQVAAQLEGRLPFRSRSLSIAAVRPSDKTAAALAGEPAEYRGQPGRRSALPAARVRHAAAACLRVQTRLSLSQQERGRRLIEAARQGAAEQLREMLAAGADVGARVKGLLGDSCTALHVAAGEGHVTAASCLVGAGAEVDARTSVYHWTPLHLAAESGHAGVVRLLVGASADPNARDWWGQTPLHRAAERGEAEAATELLLAGADRGARDVDGRTPLDLARQNRKQELVAMLRQR
ncbi:CARD- and ANK-domain containing inflammasome adapter protein-like [Schistocerca serialis cubense]|uniref:CARD- and ANK-domain containing inflammasome adapter protein-like n=1 Tax=Schistocerca serialis cubense TaxID=2023355 RepID=UPI00214E7BA3|nr:CARD- and ANK-domain containing inflammasome adapter protein-like [Schistocerca serialis cubense]